MPEDFSPKLIFPHNVGVVLAVNAIADAYLVLDGPGCSFYRAMMIHGRHDWTSSLLSCDGNHRFQYAGVSAHTIATNYEGLIGGAIRKVAALKSCGVALVTALPMCTVAGTDYSRILRRECAGKPAALIPARSLAGGWFDGYGAALAALAETMDLSGGERRSKTAVAVVGYFMDRGEGDHRGNIAELGRMCAGAGLELVSVWPSGGSYARLRDIRRAQTVISLPHGRKAAAVLAKRLKARLVVTELPFGLQASAAWLRKAAAATGRAKAAEKFIDRELSRIVPRLEWAIPFAFLNKKLVFVGDPHLLEGLRGICEELGMRLSGAFLTGRSPESAPARSKARGAAAYFEPRVSRVLSAFARLQQAGQADLVISHTDGLAMLKPAGARMEFGFPSVWTHSIREEPYLGFEGYLSFVDRMAKALVGKKAPVAEKLKVENR